MSIGGVRRRAPSNVTDGGDQHHVDMTVTDFYAVAKDMTGHGHTFAFAVAYYDPNQGL